MSYVYYVSQLFTSLPSETAVHHDKHCCPTSATLSKMPALLTLFESVH